MESLEALTKTSDPETRSIQAWIHKVLPSQGGTPQFQMPSIFIPSKALQNDSVSRKARATTKQMEGERIHVLS